MFTTELYKDEKIPEEDLDIWDSLYEKVLRIQMDYDVRHLLAGIKEDN